MNAGSISSSKQPLGGSVSGDCAPWFNFLSGFGVSLMKIVLASIKKLLLLSGCMLATSAYALSQNFAGFSLAVDYASNSIKDKSNPGDSITSTNGMPSITADYHKAATVLGPANRMRNARIF